MPIWDYPEPNDEEEERLSVWRREYDPDFEYDERRASELIDD